MINVVYTLQKIFSNAREGYIKFSPIGESTLSPHFCEANFLLLRLINRNFIVNRADDAKRFNVPQLIHNSYTFYYTFFTILLHILLHYPVSLYSFNYCGVNETVFYYAAILTTTMNFLCL